MNHRKIAKFLLFFCTVLTLMFVVVSKSYASDYQYKVLDPKYNPYAQDLIDGKLSTPTDEYVPVESSKKFDFKAFLAVTALVLLSAGIFTFALKTLKNVSNPVDTETQTLGNIKIRKEDEDEVAAESEETVTESEDFSEEITNESELQIEGKIQSEVQNEIELEIQDEVKDELLETKQQEFTPVVKPKKTVKEEKTQPVSKISKAVTNVISPKKEKEAAAQKTVEEPKDSEPDMNPIGETLKKYFTSPVSKIPNPMLLNTSPLTRNKGLCVVEYNKKYSLIGYINNEIFLLDQFENLKSYEIRSRLTESKNSTDRYIVRLGEYKALVEVNDEKMSLLLEL